jgi:hypothetical protein
MRGWWSELDEWDGAGDERLGNILVWWSALGVFAMPSPNVMLDHSFCDVYFVRSVAPAE